MSTAQGPNARRTGVFRLKPIGEIEDETDAVLVVAIARGDAAAFRQLTDKYLVAVHRLAARMLGDPNEAEEVAQDVFLKLWTHASRWRPATA